MKKNCFFENFFLTMPYSFLRKSGKIRTKLSLTLGTISIFLLLNIVTQIDVFAGNLYKVENTYTNEISKEIDFDEFIIKDNNNFLPENHTNTFQDIFVESFESYSSNTTFIQGIQGGYQPTPEPNSNFCNCNLDGIGPPAFGDDGAAHGSKFYYSTTPQGSNPSGNVYSRSISVTPNTNYRVSFYYEGMNENRSPARLELVLNGVSQGSSSASSNWQIRQVNWNSGSSTSLNLTIRNNEGVTDGNDFKIDYISCLLYTSPSPRDS